MEKEVYRMKKLFALLLTLAMVLSLAACGGDTTAEDTTGDDTNTETQEPTGDTTLTTVEEGKLIMSTNAAFPPYEMTDDSGNVVGIDAEIAAAIAEKLGLELQIDDMDFDAAQLAVQNGKVDCVVIDQAPAQEFVAANPGLTILDTEYANEDYAIGMAKGNTVLVEAVNGALNELISDGTVQSIIDSYITAE